MRLARLVLRWLDRDDLPSLPVGRDMQMNAAPGAPWVRGPFAGPRPGTVGPVAVALGPRSMPGAASTAEASVRGAPRGEWETSGL